MASFLSKLCTPAFVYFVLGVFSILVAFMFDFGFFSLLAKFIMILVWTWFLNYLCIKNLVGLSWFLVILPFVVLLVSVLLAMDAMEMKKKSHQKSVQQVVPSKMVASSPMVGTSMRPVM
jgi:hypothetical protein